MLRYSGFISSHKDIIRVVICWVCFSSHGIRFALFHVRSCTGWLTIRSNLWNSNTQKTHAHVRASRSYATVTVGLPWNYETSVANYAFAKIFDNCISAGENCVQSVTCNAAIDHRIIVSVWCLLPHDVDWKISFMLSIKNLWNLQIPEITVHIDK